MTDRLFIDIETYSSTPLPDAGVYRYAQDPEFLILMAAYATEDDLMLGRVRVAIGEDEVRAIPGLYDADVQKIAHNAQFERICFSALAGMAPGEYVSPAQYLDTMAIAAEWGYPRKLEHLAKAIGAEDKDTAGTRLINMFCKPNRAGGRTLPEDKPTEWEAFVEYCRQDVATMIDIYDRLAERHTGPDGTLWPTPREAQLYQVDQIISDRGIPVDLPMVAAARDAAAVNGERAAEAMRQLTGIENPNSNLQLLDWFRETGLNLPNLQKKTVDAALQQDDLAPQHRQALELRQQLALVAAKKYTAALDRSNEDGRLRGSIQFFGAHTGRWAGRGVQLQNLPSDTMDDPKDVQLEKDGLITEEELGRRTELRTDAALLDLHMGDPLDPPTLKALVRAMFVGPFTVVDFAAIEARVVAWLAGETWALDAFADGRDIYVETAERMGGLSRKEGKVAVLALGYNGGKGSLAAMGADGDDAHLQMLVDQWRDANPNIVNLWAAMGDAFVKGGPVGEHLRIEKDGADRYLHLPSGRVIGYHGCRRVWETDKFGRRRQRVVFSDPSRYPARTGTYGGKLVENATQAVARDILAAALLRLHDAGYEIVGHVHDEVLVRGVGRHSVGVVSGLMNETPKWAKGLPIASAGFKCQRYRKG